VALGEEKTLIVKKTPQILQKLAAFTNSTDAKTALSASSLNDYMNCSLRFYFAQVLKLIEEEEVTELIEGAQFGTLFHAIMENIYQTFENQEITKDILDVILKNPHTIDKAINLAFAENYFHKKDGKMVELEGNNLLIAKILRKYAIQILKIDKSNAPFVYCQSEKRVYAQVPINSGTIGVNIKGFIDRLDEKNGVTRIVDYKTGHGDLKFRDVAEMFESDNKKRPKYAFQTFLYCFLLDSELKGKRLVPSIIFLRDVFKKDFSADIIDKTQSMPVSNFLDYKNEFLTCMTTLLEEIFNPEIPFEATAEIENCKYCAFAKICGKHVSP
jgi:ATP-dependent exoDNAse (exonuclease V) beta subunit